ncbi:MAG: cytochrome c [Anaerolineae bacterium]|nr:cytochrome c [Anaerolineae bacterium]
MRRILTLTLILCVAAACSPAGRNADTDFPPGDAARGAVWFTESLGGAPACSTCHTLDGTKLTGPSFQGFSAAASTRIEGLCAEDYVHTSIMRPADYLVNGFGNSMYNQYGQRLSPQQIADLTAYLLTL